MKNNTFELKAEHLQLLSLACVDWDESEFGAPAINPKRPYGNSGVAYHIFDILGWVQEDEDGLTDEEWEKAVSLHRETQTALEIILHLRTFQLGLYRDVAPEHYRTKWEFVGATAPLNPPSRL